MKKLQRFIIYTFIISAFALTAEAREDCAKYSTDLNSDQEYRIVFGDSGVGGLIFALDVAQELESKLKALKTKYKVNFTFNHFGDSKNAPYGNKKPEEIKRLTKNFLSYLLSLPNTHSAVIACNTASTVFDSETHEFFQKKYPDVKIITMIDESSLQLLKSTSDNGKNLNTPIAIMATPATIKSGSYQNKISELNKNNSTKLYSYAPQTWVKNIESGNDKKIAQFELNNDLEIFRNQIGQDFEKIGAIGLFCTHYPFYKKQIQEFFVKNGNSKIMILTQGHIFSEKIYADIMDNLQKFSYEKRAKKIPYKCTKNITINSELSGENIAQTKDVISHTHPKYLKKISFKKVVID